MVPADRYMLVQSNARGGDSRVGHRRQNPNHTRRRRASNKAGFTHLALSSDRQTALSTTPISGDRRGAHGVVGGLATLQGDKRRCKGEVNVLRSDDDADEIRL